MRDKEGQPKRSESKASAPWLRPPSPATLRAVLAEELDLVMERLPRHQRIVEIPTALRDWLLPIDWDRERLWALDLPRRRLELKALRWHLNLPWWRHDGVWCQLTPREFL